jgi:hypothetical protein
VPLVGLALLGALAGQRLLLNFYFPGAFMLLSVLLVALFWGVWPALFAVLLATIAFDYAYFPPAGQFNLTSWNGTLHILLFFISGVIIAIITGQRESARLNALLAEQTHRLSALVDVLLDLSSIRSGKIPLRLGSTFFVELPIR